MAALVFPSAPTVGQRYPANPGTSGTTQYRWDGTKWNVVFPTVSLGTANQAAYNNYRWPLLDGAFGEQLTTNGAGILSWEVPATTELVLLDNIGPQFNNLATSFFLELGGNPFTPTPWRCDYFLQCPCTRYNFLRYLKRHLIIVRGKTVT